jgi:GAF domain-containing protein/CheY-like chemotaxis protein
MLFWPGVSGSRSFMRSSTRNLLFGAVLAAVVASAVGLGGVAVTLRHLALSREEAAARAQEALALAVSDTQTALRREARLLAREPALVDGVVAGDWATVARGVSPRLTDLTLERIADLVLVLDASGAPILQAPPHPSGSPRPDPVALSATPPSLTSLGDHSYVVGSAPVMRRTEADESRPLGFVVLARKLENTALGSVGLVLLEGDRVHAVGLAAPTAAEWSKTAAAGRLVLPGGRSALVRPATQVAVSGQGHLWLLISDAGEGQRSRLFAWLAALGAATFLSACGALLLVARRRVGRPPLLSTPPPFELSDPDGELQRRNRELEALNAVALSMGRSADVVATAGEMLDVVRSLAQMDVGAVNRLDPGAGTLVLIAQRGLTPEFAEQIRLRPVEGSYVGEAARTGRLIVTHLDPAELTDPHLTQLQAMRAHRTQLALPIPVKGRTWGVMSLISRERRDFLQEEIKVLESVAHQIGQVVERALLLSEMEEQSRRLETLARTGHELTAARSLEEVLHAVVTAARGLVTDGAARLAIVEGERLVFFAEAGLRESPADRPQSVAFGEGITGRAAQTLAPVVSEGILDEPHMTARSWLTAEGFVSGVAIPLLVRERLVGVLSMMTRVRHSFGVADMDLLLSFASHAAIAIDNAQLFAQAQASAARYRALFEISRALASALEPDLILDAIVERCQSLTGAAGAGIFRVDPDTRMLGYLRAVGMTAEFVHSLRVRIGEGTAGRAVRDRLPVWTEDILSDPTVPLEPGTRELIEREGYRSVLSVPIVIKGEAWGGITMYWWQPHSLSAGETEVMTALADQAAVAIENARLFSDERTGRAYLSALLEVNKKIGTLGPTEALLTSVAEEAMRLLDLDNAGFRLLDGDELVLAGLAGTASETMVRPRLKVGESAAGRVVETGIAIITEIGELSDFVPEHIEAVQRLGYTHYMGLPLRLGDRIIGVLTFRSRRAFTRRDQEVAEAFAGQAAIALEHSRLFNEAARQAERLRSLARVNQLISSSLDTDEVLAGIAGAAAALMDVPVVAVWVADAETETLKVRAFSDAAVGESFPVRTVAFGHGGTGWVAQHRQALSIPDMTGDPRMIGEAWWRERALTSYLGMPILLQDQLLGVVVLCGRVPFKLNTDERDLLESFVAQAAVAIRNAGLYAQTAQRLEQTRALLEVAEILNSSLDPKQMLKRACVKIAQVCRVDRCSVEGWSDERVVPLMSQYSDGRREDVLWARFTGQASYVPSEVPAYAQLLSTLRPVVIPDVDQTDLVPREWAESFGFKACMLVPLIRQRRVMGVIQLDYTERLAPWEAWQADLAVTIAGQLALSLDNTRLYAEAQERLQETTTLLAVSRALSEPEAPEQVMRSVAREVGHAFGADMVGIYRLDHKTAALVPTAGWHVPKRLVQVFMERPFRLEHMAALGDSWRQGRAAWSVDVKSDPRFDQRIFEGIDPHAVLFAPTMARGESVGAVFLVWWGGGREFSSREIRLLEGVAAQVGLAMENAELARQTRLRLEETEALLAELSVLHDLSRTVTGQLHEEDVVEAIQRQVARLLDVRHMVLAVLDETSEELVPLLLMRDGVREPHPPRWPIREPKGLVSLIASSGRPIRTDDYRGECERRGVETLGPGVAVPHWIGVPMLAGTQVVGVLSLRSMEHAFTADDERVLTNLAGLAALALRSARLYQDRTRAYEELAQAQDQLVRSEKLRALGEMASGVAHDFNNLLAAILGRAQLLLQRIEDPTARQWLQIIERSATDGASTVRRLQEFTRIRRDQPEVQVDLNQVVRDALDMTESAWRVDPPRRDIHVEITTSLEPGLPSTTGDPTELREVMTNLILNAVDAMPRGGKLMLATARRGDKLELCVRDTGVGIPEAVRSKIFDPFFTTKGPKGTGLGLSMTYGILSRHGATIAVDSVEGQGTTFTMLFPAGTVTTEPAAETKAAPPVSMLRCLVVDDEEVVGDVVADVLRSVGHTAVLARNAAEALSLVRVEPFDLIFTDLSMPGMTGWELARAVRATVPDLPVILVSGFAVEVSAEELQSSGIHAVLAKPINITEVLAAAAAVRPRRARGEKRS